MRLSASRSFLCPGGMREATLFYLIGGERRDDPVTFEDTVQEVE